MTQTPHTPLSPRDMRRLGDWVLENYADVDKYKLNQVEAAHRAAKDLEISLTRDDLLTAYESVDIEWRQKPVDTDASLNKDLAAMADAIRDLCVSEELLAIEPPAGNSRQIRQWNATAFMMAEIRDRFFSQRAD